MTPNAAPTRLLAPLRRLAEAERSEAADRMLALILTFVAGALNAGGLLVVGQYTSHMSGILSAMADQVALGAWLLALAGLLALLPFMLGAACSAWLINWARRHRARQQYAWPLLLEAALLLGFALLSEALRHEPAAIKLSIAMLCFVMGLQNATVTKVSGARMRTTHMTGIVTDIGIELGKLAYWNRGPGPRVRADREKLGLLACLLGCFFAGGVAGGLGFAHLGFVSAVPLALLLGLLGAAPLLDERLSRRA